MQMRIQTRPRQRMRNRWAAATVEFALCAPVFFFLVFGGIELSRVNMLIHTVESSLLQGARRGIIPGATADQCRKAAQDVLDIGRIRTSTITVSPATITDATTSVTISVSVPLNGNGYQASSVFLGKTISRTATLSREN
jgi:Flp pilus assembly protein TadG